MPIPETGRMPVLRAIRSFVFLGLVLFLPIWASAQSVPQIVEHPKSRNALAGESHTFTVNATGELPLFYQWFFNGSVLSGATSSGLPLANIQPSNAGPYQVVVSNAVGSVTSVVATLVVRGTNDPSYPPPEAGWSYLFAGNAAASSASAALDGTWVRATATSDSWGGDGRGAGNGLPGGLQTMDGILTIEDAVASGTSSTDNRRFYMMHSLAQEAAVTNANTLLSDGVTMTFRARLTPPPPADPLTELTNAPNGYVNVNSGKGMFGIRQAGLNGMLISFTLNGAVEDLSASSTFNFGQAGLHMNTLNGDVRSAAVDPGFGTLNVLPIDPSQFHEFWITVEDNGTNAGTHRVSIYVDGGTSPSVFHVTAGTGSESPSSITNYLALGLPSTGQRGAYDIDFYGYTPGIVAPAGYNDPVQIVAAPTNRTVALGETAAFAATVSGTPPFGYQWYRNGTPLPQATNRYYTTPAVVASDDFAEFRVVVSNFCNIVTSAPPAVLRIVQPPIILAQPQGLTVNEGDPASFTVTVDSAAPVSYQWRLNSSPLANETNQTLALAAVQPSQGGNYDVVVTNVAGAITSAVATLVVRLQDFGDAPASYSTLKAQNGARHLIVAGIHLGTNVDAEVDGLDSAAIGDDTSGNDDEDGVTFTSPLRVGQVATVQVVAATAGVLNAWIDFDGDGGWADPGEQIFTNLSLTAGTNLLQFTVPTQSTALDTFSRFRFSTGSGLSFDGPAADGEVEDYAVSIVPVADLMVSSNDSADPIALSNPLTYTLTITNAGPSTAGGVVLTNVLDPAVTFMAAASAEGSCEHNAGLVRCFFASLPSQSTASVTISVTPTLEGTVTNTAIVSSAGFDPAPANNETRESTEVQTPPSITAPPASLVVTQGHTAILAVNALGSPTLNYQWFFEANSLANATNAILSLADIQLNQSGAYAVRVTNRVGSVMSAPATITVLVPPAITQQPQSSTNNAGSDVTLAVVANGSTPLSYQWHSGAGAIAGATGATLSLSNIQKTQAGDYFAIVSNTAGVVTSAVARITILEVDFGDAPSPYPTVMTGNGARHTLVSGVHLGAFADFEPDGQPGAAADGDDSLSADDEDGVILSGPLLIGHTNTIAVIASTAGTLNAWLDWNRNGSWEGDQIVTNRALAGGTNLISLPVPVGTPATNTFARFRFSSSENLSFDGPAPDGEVEDYAVTLVSSADLGVTASRTPNPVAIGSNLVYNVLITNRGPSDATAIVVSNIFSGNIGIVSAVPSQGGCAVQAGTVTCSLGALSAGASVSLQVTVVPNAAQTLTNTITVNGAETDISPGDNAFSLTTEVQVYPAISVHPQPRTVTNGATVQFSVTATGTGLGYQWRLGSSDLPNQTNATLTITNVQSSNAGAYSVLVTNGVGAITSAPATLTVVVAARITSQPESRTVLQGATAAFSVIATGSMPIGYQWFFNGTEIPGAVSSTLTIGNVQPEHEGTYRVLVSNSAGSEESQPASLTILVPPTISAQPPSQTNYAGATAVFSVTATGTQPLTYRWHSNGVAIANATNSTLTLTNLTKTFQGQYFVTITNVGGAVTSAVAQLTVIEADFGDAAGGYPTLLLFDGARHEIVPGIRLGAAVDFEPDGQPNATATGDDLIGDDDEDGVFFTSPVVVGQNGTVGVIASTNGYVDAWIDFDGNGSWADLPDQILARVPVVPGSNALSYSVPSFATPSNSFARFRFSTAGNLRSDGPANDGEVEDYAVAILRAADLSLDIISTPEPAPAFSNLTYSVAVSNLGPSTATAIRLTNVLPVNVQFIAATSTQGSCTTQAGVVTCQVGTLLSGAAANITIVIAPQRSGLLTNSFVAAAAEIDPNPANHTIAHIATVTGASAPFFNTATLPIADNGKGNPYPSTITVSTLTATVQKVTVTLSNVTHDFPGDLDVLLVGPNGQSVLLLSDGGSGSPASGITLTFDDESPIVVQENSRLIEGVFKPTNYGTPDLFPTPAPGGPYSNQLAVFRGMNPNGVWSLYIVDDEAMDFGQISSGWSLQFTTLEPLADAGVTIRAQPEPVAVESNLTYTITVTNRGPAAATSLLVTDLLPPEVTFVSANTALGSCSHSNGVVTCVLPTLARNTGGNITLMARPNRGGSITNRVSIFSIDADLITSNNTASVVSSVRAVADLVLSMTQTPEPAAFGGDIIYSLLVSNRGPNQAHAVTITDPLPLAVTFISAAASQGGCANIGGTIECLLGELPAFAVATATITGRVSFIGPFTNSASVSADEIELNAADNVASDVTTGVGLFGFSTTSTIVTPSQGAAAPYPSTLSVSGLTGEVYEVTVTLSNMFHPFPDDLDILLVGPEGQSAVLMSDAGDGTPISNVILTFNDAAPTSLPDSSAITSGRFKPSQYAPADVFPAPAPAGPFATNLAVFKNTDPNGAWSLFVYDDTSPNSGGIFRWGLSIATLHPIADLAAAAVASPNPVAVGSILTYTISTTNNGPAPALAVKLTNTLPSSVTFVSVAPETGTCSHNSGTVVCDLGTLAAGASARVAIRVTANSAGPATNDTIVASQTRDHRPLNNGATVVSLVESPPAIVSHPQSLTVTNGDTVAFSVAVNGTPPFTYQWQHNGSDLSDATNATLPIANAQLPQAGVYRTRVNNRVGSILSDPASLTVRMRPVISGITNRIVNEDTATAPIAFTVEDAETPAAALTISAASSNPTLVSMADITLSGTGTNRSVQIRPATNQFGVATITVVVQDTDGLANSSSFDLEVRSVNDLPVLASIPNQTTPEDVPPTIGLTIGDVETGVETLSLSLWSSNPLLAPTNTAVFGGSGSNRTVQVFPAPNEFGAAFVTVIVTDADGGSTSNSFDFTVLPINDFPTLDPLSAVSVDEDAVPLLIPLAGITSGAANESQALAVTAQSSNPSLVGHPSVSYTSPNSTGTLTLTFNTNAHGAATITVGVEDGSTTNGAALRTFEVTVRSVNDLPRISSVADMTINEDGIAEVEVTIEDLETSATQLTITGLSSNAILVPGTNIVSSGDSSNRLVTIWPAPNQFGATTVVLTVTDGDGGSATTTFVLNVAPVNDPPSIEIITDMSFPEDAGLQTIQITGIGSGAPNEEQGLTVTAIAELSAATTNVILSYASPSPVATLSFGTISNASGATRFTITVDDGGSSNNLITRTFHVDISAVNDLPSLSPIPDQLIDEDTATPLLPFTVGDVETATTDLVVSAISSDTQLIPLTNVLMAGNDTVRSVMIMPAPDRFGTAVVTLVLSDTVGGTNTTSFTVGVQSINDLPFVSNIAPQVTLEDVPLSISFIGGDVETATMAFSLTSSNSNLLESVVFAGSGTNRIVTITPTSNYFGSGVVRLIATDGDNASVSAQFYMVVNPVNDAPMITGIADQQVSEGDSLGPIAFSVSDIESGAHGLTLSATSSDPMLVPPSAIALGGSEGARTISITPAPTRSGAASINITARDAAGDAASTTFVLTVLPRNDAPQLSAIANQATAEDTTLYVPFAVSDIDTPLNSVIVAVMSSSPALLRSGGITITGNGADRTLQMTPEPNASGATTLTMVVTDGQSAATNQFQLTVAPVNDPPTIDTPATIVVNENAGFQTIPLSGIGSGAPDESQLLALSATADNLALITSLSISYTNPAASGTLSFAVANNVTGSAMVSIAVDDGAPSNNMTMRSFRIEVRPVDDPPQISAIPPRSTAEDTPLSVPFTVNDPDTPLQNLIVSAVSTNQSLVANSNLTVHGAGPDRIVAIVPSPDQFGTTEIAIIATDGTATNTQRFLLTVSPVNDPPGLSQPANVALTAAASPHVMALSGIHPGAANEPQTVSISAVSSNPGLVPNPPVTYTNSSTVGFLNLTPSATSIGTAIVTITANDGATSNNVTTRTFTVYVRQSDNASPIISAVSDQWTPVSTPITVNFQVGDMETAAGNLTLGVASSNPVLAPPANLVFGGSGSNRTLQATPVAGQSGSTVITLSVADPAGAVAFERFTLNVTSPPPALALSPIANQVIPEDGTLRIPFTIQHPFPELSTVAGVSTNTSLIANTNILFDGSGSNRIVTLRPSLNATGQTLIVISATNSGSVASRSFIAVVTPVNDPPTLNPLSDIIADSPGNPNASRDVALSGITSGAPNEAQALTVTAVSSATTIATIDNITYASPASSGTLRLRLVRDAIGSTVITVNVSDGQATNSRSFTVYLKSSANTPPTISAIASPTINEDNATSALPFTVADATTPTAQLILRATSLNTSLVPPSNIVFGGSGANRTVTVTPVPNLSGIASVVVSVTDTNFGSAHTNFTVTVAPVNDPPSLAVLTNRTMLEDGGRLLVPLVIGDLESPPDFLSLSNASSNELLVSPSNIVFSGTGSNRVALITPGRDRSGSANITITARDPEGGSVARAFTLNVSPVNDAPTLDELNDISMHRGGTQMIPLTGISSGGLNENDTLTITALSSQPGTVAHPQVVYTSPQSTGSLILNANPAAGGTAVITVIVTDGGAPTMTSTQSFTVSILSPGNGLPVVSGLSNVVVSEDTTLGPISFRVSDTETAAMDLVVGASSANPALVPDANISLSGTSSNRSLTITPLPNAHGTTVISVSATDSDFGWSSTTFTLTVMPLNDPPVASAVADQTILEDTATMPLQVVLSDVDHPVGGLTLVALSSNPTLVPASNVFFGGSGSNRTVTILPALNQTGSAMITLRANDPDGASNEMSFTVTVTPANDAPSLSHFPDLVMDEDTAIGPLPLVITDPDPGNVMLSFESSNPALLSASNIVSSGAGTNQGLTLTPITNQFGDALVTVIAADEAGARSSNTFRVSIRPVNDPPALDSIADLQVPSGAASRTVALTGINAGAPNELDRLAISAVSSNPDILPHPTISFSGPPTGMLSLNPTPGARGSVTVDVTVNDGQPQNNLTMRSFTLTIEDSPTIAQLGDVHTDEDVPAGPIALIATDGDSPGEVISMTASSSNPALIITSNVVLSGSGTNRAITLTPNRDQHGFSFITLVAADDRGNASSNTFAFVVHPVNDPPVISSIPDQDTAANQAAGPIAFTVQDIETPAQDLWISPSSSDTTLVSATNISLTGAGAVRTILVQPAPDRTGQATITLQVTDANGASANEQFLVRINDSLLAPFITAHPSGQTVLAGGTATFLVTVGGSHPMTYQWRRGDSNLPGATAAILTLASVGPGDAGDYTVVVSNAAGFVISDSAQLVVPMAVQISSISWLPGSITLFFETVSGANYTVEASDSLAPPVWTTVQTLSGNGNTANITDPAAGSPMRFYRVRAE